MKDRRYNQSFVIGAVLMVVSLSAAWSAGREPAVELAPMEKILESTAAASAAAPAVSWDLPVTRNEQVDKWIGFLSGRNQDKTQLWLERTGKYGPMIQAELRSRGMPEDLLYLALIESGLSPKAYSKAAASGMWQFIEETGERYGLEVTSEIDERRDPVEATSAALDYLQQLHDRFGSWYLAAAAYNTGENRVGRIMREEFGSERGRDSDFWRIAHRLPRETRDYVPLMLAAGHIGKEPQKYGFPELNYQPELKYDVVWVPGSTELSMIAQSIGVPAEDVADLNPHLKLERTPANRGWSVRIPEGKSVAFQASFPALYRADRLARAEEPAKASATTASAASRTHKVARGETLSHVAKRYGITVSALRAANGNVDPRRVRVGQALRVPGGKAVASAAKAAPKKATVHSVRSGENLTVIAKRYGVSVRQIRSWNKLASSQIRPGQKLRVRA